MKDAKSYDPNVDKAGFEDVFIGKNVEQVKNGGAGSGNFGHAGRPGEVGGSGEGGGSPKSTGHIGFTETHEYFKGPNGDIYRAQISDYVGTDGYRAGARFESTPAGWESLSKHVPFKNADLMQPGTAFVPQGNKTEMVTNPPYQTPELGDAPEEMQKEADRIYKALRKEQFHEETPADRESAARVMWTTLEKNWKKGKDGKWVKKEEKQTQKYDSLTDNPAKAIVPYMQREPVTQGGPGSGNFGHAGRPGEVGGSGDGGGSGKSDKGITPMPKVGERTLASQLTGVPEFHTPESVKKIAESRARAETLDKAAKDYSSKALAEAKHEAVPGGHHYIEGKHGLIMGATKEDAEAEYRRIAASDFRSEERRKNL